MSSISIKQLLEAGVHFGHQTSRWNPKMKEFIFGERNGIHIIDLQQTIKLFKEAVDFMADLSSTGKEVLFVGTKRQAQECIEEDARRCGMHFVTNRWLGGLLTNFTTVQNSIKRFKRLQEMKESGFYNKLAKKEVAQLERERKRLEKNLIGIQNMGRLPDAVFIVDSEKEAIAVKEAAKLGIPVVAVADTNCDPTSIEYVIPGNDDALRSIKLFTSTMAEAILAGRSVWDAKVAEEERIAREKAEKEAASRKAAKEAARAEKARREEAEAASTARRQESAEGRKTGPSARAADTETEKKKTAPRKEKSSPSADAAAQPETEQGEQSESSGDADLESSTQKEEPAIAEVELKTVASEDVPVKEGAAKGPSKKGEDSKKGSPRKAASSKSKSSGKTKASAPSEDSSENSDEPVEAGEEKVKAES